MIAFFPATWQGYIIVVKLLENENEWKVAEVIGALSSANLNKKKLMEKASKRSFQYAEALARETGAMHGKKVVGPNVITNGLSNGFVIAIDEMMEIVEPRKRPDEPKDRQPLDRKSKRDKV